MLKTYRHLDASERADVFEGLIYRFRSGSILPASFRLLATSRGIARSDIDEAIETHIDECARNVGHQLKTGWRT